MNKKINYEGKIMDMKALAVTEVKAYVFAIR
jgi:hypothetical protein